MCNVYTSCFSHICRILNKNIITSPSRVLVPDSTRLKEMADQLSKDLEKQNDMLNQLMKNVSLFLKVFF